ncbi:MAG: phage holin family protein [Beijerinckiaceae bacterium]|jgi:hypothetical protein
MPDDRILEAAAPSSQSPAALVSALFADLGDLVQKEVALARAEIQHNLMQKAIGSLWMAIAGLIGFVAFLTVVGGVVFLVASLGFAMHWAAFGVALGLAILSAVAFMIGKGKLNAGMAPERSMRQVRRDVATIKEQVQ